MIDNFSIFLFVNRFFKYIFDNEILNVSYVKILNTDDESDSEVITEDYFSE